MAAGNRADMFGEVKKVLTGVLMSIACTMSTVSLKEATGFIAGFGEQS